MAAFHDLASARAAAAAHDVRRPLLLLTPPGGAGAAGPAYYREIIERLRAERPDLKVSGLLDCGRDPALAHFALRAGWRDIVLGGNAAARRRIAAIAGELGARVRSRPPKINQMDAK